MIRTTSADAMSPDHVAAEDSANANDSRSEQSLAGEEPDTFTAPAADTISHQPEDGHHSSSSRLDPWQQGEDPWSQPRMTNADFAKQASSKLVSLVATPAVEVPSVDQPSPPPFRPISPLSSPATSAAPPDVPLPANPTGIQTIDFGLASLQETIHSVKMDTQSMIGPSPDPRTRVVANLAEAKTLEKLIPRRNALLELRRCVELNLIPDDAELTPLIKTAWEGVVPTLPAAQDTKPARAHPAPAPHPAQAAKSRRKVRLSV